MGQERLSAVINHNPKEDITVFSTQDWQIKLVYAGFGFLFAVIGMLLSPVTAQRDKFGEIECRRLTVVDAVEKRG